MSPLLYRWATGPRLWCCLAALRCMAGCQGVSPPLLWPWHLAYSGEVVPVCTPWGQYQVRPEVRWRLAALRPKAVPLAPLLLVIGPSRCFSRLLGLCQGMPQAVKSFKSQAESLGLGPSWQRALVDGGQGAQSWNPVAASGRSSELVKHGFQNSLTGCCRLGNVALRRGWGWGLFAAFVGYRAQLAPGGRSAACCWPWCCVSQRPGCRLVGGNSPVGRLGAQWTERLDSRGSPCCNGGHCMGLVGTYELEETRDGTTFATAVLESCSGRECGVCRTLGGSRAGAGG